MTAPYLTMADLARIYRVHESTARRWAREDAWRRTGTRPVRYSAADAQRSYEQRTRTARITRHLASLLEQLLDNPLSSASYSGPNCHRHHG